MSMLVEMPDFGLNSLVPPNELDPRGAANFTQNVLYQYGILSTPTGFAKVDLTSGLNSGDSVLATFRFTEIDGYDHHIAVTTEKIFRHDLVNNNWDIDITQSGITMNSDLWHPISWVPVLHDDTDIYLDDNTGKDVAYHHIVVCDGGLSNIQRWAGRWETDFADLLGGDGYQTGMTKHRALQVGAYKSRLILISPLEYDSSTKAWVKNNARVRFPQAGKLQTYNSNDFFDLLETNDQNVWSSLLGNQYIIYQKHSIWGLNYIGGTDVFDPLPLIKDLGLLSHHLLISRNNVHYFIGDDFNVYKYYGGTVKQAIGDEIHKNLQDDLDPDYAARCWLVMGPRNEFLWIYIVPHGSQYITKAYGRNMKTGAWTVTDLTHKWPSGSGITAVNLVGGQSYTIGDTYAEALETLSAYDADISKSTVGDITQRYGDVLLEGTVNQVDWTELDATLDFTDIEFSAGGLFFCFSASADPTKLIGDNTAWDNTAWSPLIMQIKEGSDSDNMPYGAHYYSLTDISSVDAGGGDYTVRVNLAPRDTTGNAVSDLSTDIPGINAIGADCSGSLYDPSGETYRQKLEVHRTDDALVYGDSDGYIYQADVDLTASADGEDTLSIHVTRIFDWKAPDIFKRWPGIAVVGKGDSVIVQYRTTSFDTSEGGWVSVS